MKTKSNRFWLIIIGVFLATFLALCGYLIYRAQQRSAALQVEGPVAIVYLHNQVVDVVDLGAVTEPYTKSYGKEVDSSPRARSGSPRPPVPTRSVSPRAGSTTPASFPSPACPTP